MTTKTLVVSAPGKILLAGGYLVMESPNPGVVIGVDKRFYCTVVGSYNDGNDNNDSKTKQNNNNNNNHNNVIEIRVSSPQFNNAVWNYQFHTTTLCLTASASNASTNDFVEKTLRVTLLALLENSNNNNNNNKKNDSNDNDDDTAAAAATTTTEIPWRLELTIQGDNDFYSLVPHLQAHHLPFTFEGSKELPQFLPAARDETDDGKVLKTGLGSSACLVTSIVAALVHSLSSSSCITNDATNGDAVANDDAVVARNSKIIYKLSQICHCHAQGKVGSGFDVAAACFGSHIYQRFPKETMEDLLAALEEQDSAASSAGTAATAARDLQTLIRSKLSNDWEGGLQAPLTMSCLQVLLADVSGGSESPSMARNVLAWKKKQQESSSSGRVPHWDDLATLNPKVGDLWKALSAATGDGDTTELLETLASQTASEWKETCDNNPVARLLVELHLALSETRRHLKAMGDAAGVPIEPPEQTALADATMTLPGVVAALVPGAGGYDALACVYINTVAVRQSIETLWTSWHHHHAHANKGILICPLTVQGISFGDGVRVE